MLAERIERIIGDQLVFDQQQAFDVLVAAQQVCLHPLRFIRRRNSQQISSDLIFLFR